MRRHASPEDLACLDLGGLKPRKAQKIRAHLAICVMCTETNRQLTVVQTTLASVSYPSIPEQFCTRIETVLAAESAHRIASVPASAAGRRDLPERSRRSRANRGDWHFPGMSVLATRLAAAGALVVVGVGGYEIASHAGGNVAGTAATSRGSVTAPGAIAGQMSFGPSVRYGEPSSIKHIRLVTSNTNFTSASLGSQALAAIQAARLPRGTAGQASGGPAPSAHANSSAKSAPGTATATPSTAQLASCLDGLVGNHTVLLVEQAKYEGKQATIIVTAAAGNREAEVWAVGPSCSAAHPDVLAHQSLART